jgi:hypothetical protein
MVETVRFSDGKQRVEKDELSSTGRVVMIHELNISCIA